MNKYKKISLIVVFLGILILIGNSYGINDESSSKTFFSLNKNADINKFNLETINLDCIKLTSPKSIKNWMIQVYWANVGESYDNNKILEYDHYNDGINSQKICYSDITKQIDYNKIKNTNDNIVKQISVRVVLKATNDDKKTLYKGISYKIWRPSSIWDYDAINEWVYKDTIFDSVYDFISIKAEEVNQTGDDKKCYKYPGFKDYCLNYNKGSLLQLNIDEPSKKEYHNNITLDFSMTKNYKWVSLWGREYPLYYKIITYEKNNNEDVEINKSSCKSIKYLATRKFSINLNKPNQTLYAKVIKYNDEVCSGDGVEIARTGGYRLIKKN